MQLAHDVPKPETALRVAYALLAFILGLSATVLFTFVPSETWVRVVGMVGAYSLGFLGVLVVSGRGPGGRLMLSGKGPSSRFLLTRQRWKYVVVAGLAAVSIIVGVISAIEFLVNPALPLFQWLLIAFLANLIEPVRKNQLVDRA
ncbi:hypothetical protein J2W15_002533 [Pseudarthrobacter sulfonivorans]|nr:hypothetical protein [Pseudarthrobacter sulfonivorans]